jgi:chemotaxis protein CheD
MGADQTMVRMGQIAASARRGHRLVALGLGSCIGLGVLDRGQGIAGLAHVVLPAAPEGLESETLKFADHAVPALVRRLVSLGAHRAELEAVLVGGASMFAASPTLEVGSRNEAAVREALAAVSIPVLASATGGSRGRTVRIDVATASVTVREVGGSELELVPARPELEVAS